MLWLQKIKDSPNYPRLKNSLQYRYDRKQFLIIAIALGALYLFTLPLILDLILYEPGREGGIAALLLMSFITLPLIAWFAYRWLRLFLHIDVWCFSEAVLDKPHAGYKGGVYFTVTVTDRRGNKKLVDTTTMFFSSEPRLEDYVNRSVLIGYNEETEVVAVIRRLD